MLLDGHELDDVVSELGDVRECILRKLLVGSDTRLRSTYTDMCFIDADGFRFRWARVLEFILLRRIPENGFVNRTLLEVLSNAPNPRRKAIDSFSAGSFELNLDFLVRKRTQYETLR